MRPAKARVSKSAKGEIEVVRINVAEDIITTIDDLIDSPFDDIFDRGLFD